MRFFLTISSIFYTMASVYGQCTLSLSGHVHDTETKEHLHQVSVYISELKQTAQTDSLGNFRFRGLCSGKYTIIFSHAGCTSITRHIHLKADYELDILLEHRVSQLKEVVVHGEAGSSQIMSGETIKGIDIKATRGLSLAESLKGISGVTLLQTGSNISKPLIHGLHSNRVLIVNNGIRQEGQQWGSEHAPEIDPFVANRITVIKGSGALRYGGDAIAGVVLVEPKLLPTDPGIGGEINLAAFTNNRMGVLSGMFEGNIFRYPAFSWRLQGTLKRAGNARTPNYWLANSGLKEMNFSVAAAINANNKGVDIFYSQFNTQLGIFTGSHIGNVTDLWNSIQQKDPPDYIRNTDFTYTIDRPYQQVHHQLLKIKSWKNTGDIGRLQLIVSGQYNQREEYDIKRFSSSSDAPQLNMRIGTILTELVWDHYKTGRWRGTIGSSFMYQNNQYQRRLFIPNYQSGNASFFITEKFKYEKWDLEGGIRFDQKSIYDTRDNENRFVYTDLTFRNFSGNMGLLHRLTSQTHLQINTSSAWRSPQVNELYANGLHHGAARLERGNTALQPERSFTITTGITTNTTWLNLDINLYIKNISGFIFLRPDFPPELTIRGAFPAFSYNQTNARLHGFDLNTMFHVNKHLDIELQGSVLRAWDKKAKDWIIQMPADRLDIQLSYQFSNTGKIFDTYIKGGASYVARQIRFPAHGNIEIPNTDPVVKQSDYLLPPPAYMLAKVEVGTKFRLAHQDCDLILTANNLLNKAYRDYMNTFRYFSDETGRNISLRLHIPFVIIHQHK